MNVSELKKILDKYPDDMMIVYNLFSEQCLLTEENIGIKELSLPRPDGWVENKRPDKESRTYLVFPGN